MEKSGFFVLVPNLENDLPGDFCHPTVQSIDNIIDINNDITNQQKKKLKATNSSSYNNSFLQSLTNNPCLLTIAQHNIVSFHNHTK